MELGAPPPRDGHWRWRKLQLRSSPLPSSPLGGPEDPRNLPKPIRLWEHAPLAEQGTLCGLYFASPVSPLAGPPLTVLAGPGGLRSRLLSPISPAGQPGTRAKSAHSKVVEA